MARIPFIPVGELEKESAKSEAKAFFENPLVPWWTKVAHKLVPNLKKETRAATWCKRCARKHPRNENCEALTLVKDLTAPPTKTDDVGRPIENREVGFYSTALKEKITV